MTRNRKPIPKNQSQITQEAVAPPLLVNQGMPISDSVFSQNRGEDLSMRGDTVKDISVGLEDIDDAISLVRIIDKSQTNYRLSIHISDVSYWMKPETHLDKIANQLGATYYGIDKNFPIFPPVEAPC